MLEIADLIFNKKLIVIAGNLAVGKTTLASKIGIAMNWFVGYESVIDNPYIEDYYSDIGKWAYHLQIYFLGNRINLHSEAHSHPKSAILDRSIYEDAEIFAKALLDSGKLSVRDFDAYMSIYRYLVDRLPVPDLIVYISAPIEIIMKRIRTRGQKFDHDLGIEYLQMIQSYYEKWISSFSLCPILSIDSEYFNYYDNCEDMETVKDLVLNKLSTL